MNELKKQENKQTRALRQFNLLRPEILKLFLGAPEYGTTKFVVHFQNGEISRISHGFKQSIIPENIPKEQNENE
jgi:hypothetical protein